MCKLFLVVFVCLFAFCIYIYLFLRRMGDGGGGGMYDGIYIAVGGMKVWVIAKTRITLRGSGVYVLEDRVE